MANTDNVYTTVLAYQAIAVDETKHPFIMKVIGLLCVGLKYLRRNLIQYPRRNRLRFTC